MTSSRLVMVIVGVVFVLVAAIGLWAQMQYALHGVRGSAFIVDAAGVSRSHSVTAQVEVTLPGEKPIRTEIEDSLGGQHWTPGGRAAVICTHIHADHMTCIADIWFDRYALGFATLMAGCGALWAGLRRRG